MTKNRPTIEPEALDLAYRMAHAMGGPTKREARLLAEYDREVAHAQTCEVMPEHSADDCPEERPRYRRRASGAGGWEVCDTQAGWARVFHVRTPHEGHPTWAEAMTQAGVLADRLNEDDPTVWALCKCSHPADRHVDQSDGFGEACTALGCICLGHEEVAR